MTDATPTPAQQPVEPGPDTPRRSRRTAVVGVGLGTAALVLGGGAFAYSQLSGGGPQPADVLPASTDAYVRLDLDPSASQKVEIFRLLRKIPEVGEAVGIDDPNRDDLRKLVFEGIAEDTCPDLDYEADVEPWLGDRLGVGLNGEQVTVAAQIDDETAAEKGLDALIDCTGEEIVYDFTEGYAVISNEQKAVDEALDAVRDGETLATADSFTADMSALGDQGVASVWVDVEGLFETFAEDPSIGGSIDDASREQIEEAGSVALTLRADGSALELAGVAKAPEKTSDPAPIGDLPADTVIALSVAGAGEQVSEQWAQLEEAFTSGFAGVEDELGFEPDTTDDPVEGPTDDAAPTEPFPTVDPEILEGMDEETRQMFEDLQSEYGDETSPTPTAPSEPTDPIQSFEDATGLALPDDLSTLLGKSITLAIGASNLETIPSSSGPGDLAALDIGLRTVGDAGETEAVLQKLADLAADNDLELFVEPTDDGGVLATNAEAAKALTGGGRLGSSDTFTSVMPYGDDTVGGLFVDVSTVIDKLLEADPPEDVRADLEDAKAVRALGLSAATDGDHSKFSARVSFVD